jgi:dihydrolipoamide dehydrogenase
MADAEHTYDLVVVGSGPGGYVAAIRAAQLGLKTACVEKESALGGTCLRVGCIPSKALLESSELYTQANHDFETHGIKVGKLSVDLAAMLQRKEKIVSELTGGIGQLFKKNKITAYTGHGRLDGPGKVVVDGADGATTLTAKSIIIATGSRVATIPSIEMDWDKIGGSTEALSYPKIPKHLVVIGAGVIGLELGSVWLRLGAKVTVLEMLDRILPGIDTETAKRARVIFKKQGFDFRLGTRVAGARPTEKGAVVDIEGAGSIECDRVLVAIGRRPYTDGLGLDSVGIETDKGGRIPIDDHFKTSAAGIYAIGDVVAGPMLAHKAEEEGIACVEHIVTGYGHINYNTIPNVVYTHPEIASVGKTEEELKEDGTPYRKGSFPFAANGRAKSLGQTDGQVKILAHEETDRILGVHIVGPRASELIAELAAAIEFGASSEDIARTCHAHPTLSEVVKEAALAVDKRTIHR